MFDFICKYFKDHDALIAQLEGLNIELTKKQGFILELEAKIQEQDAKILKLEADLLDLSFECDHIETNYETVKKDLAELVLTLETSKNDLNQKISENQNLLDNKMQIKNAIDVFETQMEIYHANLKELQDLLCE
jgi:chromosome segregation ATPase